MIADGSLGLLKVGYQEAARLRSWHLTSKQERLAVASTTVTARIVSVDPYWIQREPLTLGLWLGSTWWVWEGITIVSKGDPVVYGMIELFTEVNPAVKSTF